LEIEPSTKDKENTMIILKVILAIIFPPVAAFLQVGLGMHFWLNILLTLLGYVPGLIHALWLVLAAKSASPSAPV
jgi:uncharacterized membrane protein YqaE (UPF0057 family)